MSKVLLIPSWTTVISPQNLAELFEHNDVVVVDCRFSLTDPEAGRLSFEAEHIPGARYAHLDGDLSGEVVPGKTGRHPLPDPATWIKRVGFLGIGNSTQVIVYDSAGGAFAARFWWMLNWVGHERVAVLDGGWDAWVNGGFPTTTHVAEFEPAEFHGTADSNLLVEADEVLSAIGRGACIVDARANARYRGDEDPLDAVAGHIPSARSFPFKENLGADGTFLSAAELHSRFAPLLETGTTVDVVMYCGSGVTAAHNALAMKHAGLAMPKLYTGSWSEWITDPERPIATGDK